MAGGEGTRLRPLTSNQPKPMMPLANRPMMEHIVQLLQRHGFDDIVVTVAFLANDIRTYFGDGSEFGVRMVYATEETPLGTAGSVRNAMDELDERFLVISGDVLTDIDLVRDRRLPRGARARWPPSGSPPSRTRSSSASSSPTRTASIERFLEKPGWGQVFSDTVNNGIFVLEPEIFDYIPAGRPVDFSERGVPRSCSSERKPLYGYVCEGYWEDVGTLEAYMSAPTRTSSTARSSVDVPGLPARRRRVAGGGRRGRPGGPRRRARPSSATTAGSRPAPASGRTPCSAPT